MFERLKRKKGPLDDDLPGGLERVKRELRLPGPEDVPEDELGDPLIRHEPEIGGFEVTIPRRHPEPPPEREKPKEEPRHAHAENDRLELILSKLDTIDARLKFIEEKLKRF